MRCNGRQGLYMMTDLRIPVWPGGNKREGTGERTKGMKLLHDGWGGGGLVTWLPFPPPRGDRIEAEIPNFSCSFRFFALPPGHPGTIAWVRIYLESVRLLNSRPDLSPTRRGGGGKRGIKRAGATTQNRSSVSSCCRERQA